MSSCLSQPILILVTGAPASGKTTIAARLAADLGLPLFAKDDIKELLAESLAVSDFEWSSLTGRASFFLLDWLTTRLLNAGSSLILEANFDRRFLNEWSFPRAALKTRASIVEIFCRAEPEVLLGRYKERFESGSRHPIHHDREHFEGPLPHEITGDKFAEPLGLGTAITVDTTSFDRVDYSGILARVRSTIENG
ncbi:MAG TPA: AAA family ATPase [Thermomicrobiaceae bacterium]|nr:AAA family ATPase [Thermomicrobiaceae bacterium]